MSSAESDLFAAIKAGESDRVKAMVSADPALVDSRSETGDSAILTAVYHRRKDIVDLLVARGAMLTLHEACAAGEVDRLERLLAFDPDVNAFSHDGWTPLHLAAFFGRTGIVERLLALGADARARSQNTNGNTALHAALAGNHHIVAGLLIGGGAEVNAEDAEGWRPIHLAAASGNVHSLQALLTEGADVHVTNRTGATPLDLARKGNHREAEALLMRHS